MMEAVRRFLACIICVLALAEALAGQTLIDLRTQSKSVDFSAAGTTRPFKSGTALPATCSQGEMYFKTDAAAGGNLYGCGTANTWTVQGTVTLGGDVTGGAGAATVVQLQGRPIASTAPAAGQVLTWNASTTRWEPQAAPGGGGGGGSSTSPMGGAFQFSRTSATQLAAGTDCVPATPCNVRIGNNVYAYTGGPYTLTIAGGTGGLLLYVDSSGALTAAVNGPTVSASTGITVVSGISAFPPDAVPLLSWGAAVAGAWDATGTDRRGFLGRDVVTAGTNVNVVYPSAGKVQVNLDPTSSLAWSGPADFSGAAQLIVRKAASNPSSCTPGELFFNTTSNALQQCTGINVWSAVGSGGSSSVVQSIDLPPGRCDGAGTPSLLWSAGSGPSGQCAGTPASFALLLGNTGTQEAAIDLIVPANVTRLDVALSGYSSATSGNVALTAVAECWAANTAGNADAGYNAVSSTGGAPVSVVANGMMYLSAANVNLNNCFAGGRMKLKLARDNTTVSNAGAAFALQSVQLRWSRTLP